MRTETLRRPAVHAGRGSEHPPVPIRQVSFADTVSRHDLEQLTTPAHAEAHLSLFVPLARRRPQSAQNPIRWKNLLARAEAALLDVAAPAQVGAVLGAVNEVAGDHRFREHRGAGLAIFARPGFARCFQLPAEVPELAAVGDRFLVAPLLDLVAPGQRFLLLVLSRTRVRLFTGTRFGLEEVPEADLPLGPADPSQVRRRKVLDRPDAFLAGRGGGATGVVFFGRGSVDQQRREEILQYFRTVDAMLPRYAGGDRPPLLLAGVRNLIPLYREVSRFPHVVDDAVPIDATHVSAEELHRRAWPLVQPQLLRDEAAAAARYRDLAGTGRTLSEPSQVLAAARTGRVDVLFLATTTFARPLSGRAPVLRLTGEGSSVTDQLDQAAAACLGYGGAVHLVPADRMPDHDVPRAAPAAALLRF